MLAVADMGQSFLDANYTSGCQKVTFSELLNMLLSAEHQYMRLGMGRATYRFAPSYARLQRNDVRDHAIWLQWRNLTL